MGNIDLKKIIEDNDLDVRELAAELFPGIKYPKLALDRVLKGDTYLDTNQLSRLSMFTGLPIEVLYSGTPWKTTAKHEEGNITFEAGDYTAELDTENWITKVFHKGSIFHESVLHRSTIPLNEYLHELDKIIVNHKQ
jgi:hypothetical protein